MTVIRFMKEKAREIVSNKDPRFYVISSEQQEQVRGLYRFQTLIRELQTGKFYTATYTAGVKGWARHPVRPFDTDEPLFQEVAIETKTP